jgi:hypothetical protein
MFLLESAQLSQDEDTVQVAHFTEHLVQAPFIS